MSKPKLGYSICGSFCTFEQTKALMRELAETYEIIPIMSTNSYTMDTKFGTAKQNIEEIEEICQRKIISSIVDAEPIGPQSLTDIMLIAPCTGNTLAKLALGITDTPVVMAVKSHLRNQLPVVVAVSTNDALSNSAKNIGYLQNNRNYYFVPMRQDNHIQKPSSMVADFTKVEQTLKLALEGKQHQPMMLSPE